MEDKIINQFIETFIFLRNFKCLSAIDEMFKKMLKEDWEKESINDNKMLIVLFLRSNYQIKNDIPNYNKFLKKSIKYLKSKNLIPEEILKGIL